MSYVEETGSNPYAAPQADLSYAPTIEGRTYGYAGFWQRFVAVVIDSFIVGFVNNIIGFMLGYSLALAGVSLNVIWVAGLIVGVVLSLAYYAGMVSSSKQATLGKLAMGVKVVDLNGRRIGFGRACGRELGKILSGLIFLVGYIMAATTERKQALHDIMAGTLVVRTR